MYEPRTYRHWVKDTDLHSFSVAVEETDLSIRARRNLRRKALRSILKHRSSIEGYINRHPSFAAALEPLPAYDDAPQIVREMSEASSAAGLGPMASVAGAMAEHVGRDLLDFSPEVIVENGGDIFLKITKVRRVGIYAGESPLTGKVALEVRPEETPLGICTSSGTVGHSLSLGTADAVIVLSRSAPLADAAATAIGNMVKDIEDISNGIESAKRIDGLVGVVIIKGGRMGMWGGVRIVKMHDS
ncbi:MAG: UPF0280 family protein [Chloroflexota bacterium]